MSIVFARAGHACANPLMVIYVSERKINDYVDRSDKKELTGCTNVSEYDGLSEGYSFQ